MVLAASPSRHPPSKRQRGSPGSVDRATAAAFGSYARYWLESFRLPALSGDTLDRGIDVPAYHHVEEALERGNGVILALPHLGGWEWAGFWVATVNRLPITVVVEPLDPPELFRWFADFRERLGNAGGAARAERRAGGARSAAAQ